MISENPSSSELLRIFWLSLRILPFCGIRGCSLCLNTDLSSSCSGHQSALAFKAISSSDQFAFPPLSLMIEYDWMHYLFCIFFLSRCFMSVCLDFINLYVSRAFYFVCVPLHGRVLIIVLLFLPRRKQTNEEKNMSCGFTSSWSVPMIG